MTAAAAARSSSIDDFIIAVCRNSTRGDSPGSSQSLHTQWRLENKGPGPRGLNCVPIYYSPAATLCARDLLLTSLLIIVRFLSPDPGRENYLICSSQQTPSPADIQSTASQGQQSHRLSLPYPGIPTSCVERRSAWQAGLERGIYFGYLGLVGWLFLRRTAPAKEDRQSILDAWTSRRKSNGNEPSGFLDRRLTSTLSPLSSVSVWLSVCAASL